MTCARSWRWPVALALVAGSCSSPVDGPTQSEASARSSGAAAPAGSVADGESAPAGRTPDGPVRPPGPDDLPLPGLLQPLDELPGELSDDAAVRDGVLDNGLRYFVRSNDNPGGKAELRLVIDGGSVDEIGPSTGVAHFLEHMLFNGTERFPENELVATLRSFGSAFGADVNARTGYDSTVYELSVPNDDATVDLALGVLEQWLSAATIGADEVEAERGVVLDEWRLRTQNTGGRRFAAVAPMFLGGTAYDGRAPIGDRSSIASMSVEVLREFYDRVYRPDNAAIVVVGDIDVDEVETAIVRWFEPLEPRSATATTEVTHRFGVDIGPDALVHADPDQLTVDIEVTFPLGATSPGSPGHLGADLLDRVALDAILRRLDDDLAAGTAPFDSVRRSSNGFVTGLDAPGLVVVTDGRRARDAIDALLVEFERARRYGFTAAEIDVARESIDAAFRVTYDGRNSAQDSYYAEVCVADFLTGSGHPSIEDGYAAVAAVLDAVTTEAVDLRFRTRLANTAPHVVVTAPEAEVELLPDADEILAVVAELAGRDVAARSERRDLPDRLMPVPDPVTPTSVGPVVDRGTELFDPTRIEFPNGVTVILNSNEIVEGRVFLQAASEGGTSLVADEDLVDARFGPEIVLESGVAGFGPAEVDRILAGVDVDLDAWVMPYSEHFSASAATADVEVLLQLIHLTMTEPQVDPVVVERTISRYAPLVADPAADAGLVARQALLAARYPDEERYSVLPTPADLASLDVRSVRRTWGDRFGNSDGWVFVLSGDLDVDAVADLAARYLGTLPPGTPERPLDVSPPLPDRTVNRREVAGSGDTASASWWFVDPVEVSDHRLRVVAEVATELVTARLVDELRESAGATYAPYAAVSLALDPDPVVESYVQVSGDPVRIDEVVALVVAELADLRRGGASDEEYERAFAQVAERYRFVDNGLFTTELLQSELRDDPDLVDHLSRSSTLAALTPSDVLQFLERHVPLERGFQVTVTPR